MSAHGGTTDAAYRALFDENPHPMWVFDRATLRFLAVNDAAVRQYGYAREEFLQRTILDIRPEEDAASAAASVERAPSGSRVWRHRRKDGSSLLAEITAHSMTFMGVEARLVMAIDVTARERGAEALRRSNRTLQAVLEAAPVGLLVFDGAGRIVETNEAARSLLGAMGIEPIAETVNDVLRGEGVAHAEVEVADGRWAELSVSYVEVGPTGGAVAVLTDCTERRAREGRLEDDVEDLEARVLARTKELHASLEEIEGICFTISHDIRGPLRAVDGFAQVVLNDPESSLSPESQDSLGRVRAAARRMSDLIDGTLILSRLARTEFQPQEIDLSAIATRAKDALAQASPDRKIEFVIEPNLRAYGDPRLVAALVEQLLSNAVKFTAGRDDAKIEFYADGDGWAIRDNGVGFDMAYASRLFRPFERLHKTTEFPGNGLGLAVAEQVVRRHGGEITADAIPGEGAVFRFDLGTPIKG